MGIIDIGQKFQSKDIVRSICHWNALRYDQEHNHRLSVALLAEEHTEYLLAWIDKDLIEIVDGLADVFFVAVGAMWKHGWSPKHIMEQMDAMQNDVVFELEGIAIGIDIYAHTEQVELLAYIALKALEELEDITNEEAAMGIIRAVITSNATKDAKKTKPGTKANITKGQFYTSPVEEIKRILDGLEQANVD